MTVQEVKSEKVFLDADTILGLDDLGHEDVWVEKWQTFVRVRGLTAGERTEYSLLMAQGDSVPRDAQARLVQMCAIREDGMQLFTIAQVPQLSQKSGEALEPLSAAIMKLSGMDLTYEDAEKN